MSKKLNFITKRDGRKVKFDPSKITQAIYKAFVGSQEIKEDSKRIKEAERLTPIAVELFRKIVNGNQPTVETMQNVVEQVLMAAGFYITAKAYILYRQTHDKERRQKQTIGVKDDLNLSFNQLKVMESRYLIKDSEGKITETPRQMFKRVAQAIAANEKENQKDWEKKFFDMMSRFEYLPAGGYLRTAGTDKPMIANCFVLPVEDSMEGIFDSVKWMALIHQKGGGTGFNFSAIRPKGDRVGTSGGVSSGPISFMKVFDAATRQVMQGGFKRGANMGILNIDHPDILDFITCKTEESEINNFNISVGISDKFMQAVKNDSEFDLVNPRDKSVVQTVPARNLFDQIVNLAWRTGDPGVIFLDKINEHNPVKKTLGEMASTNPCGEQPLHPFDVCNLGSINLSAFVRQGKINWKRLNEVIRLAVRFQDNGVDISNYPLAQIKDMAQANRRIGLGVMGFADMLYKLGLAYSSEAGRQMASRVMNFIYTISHNESEMLAEEKGNFPNWKGSEYEKKGIKQRNLAITTIAPTGTISMVAECSSGIEPVFLLSFVKNVVSEEGLTYVNPIFKKALENHFDDDDKVEEIITKVSKTGSCADIDEIPEEIKKVFVTAHDISWQDHVAMQATFQAHTDNAVSKTINFPHNATIGQVEQAYLMAWEMGCKGLTIYRDGSKSFQILQSSAKQKSQEKEPVIQSKIKTESLKQRFATKQNDKLQKSEQTQYSVFNMQYAGENQNLKSKNEYKDKNTGGFKILSSQENYKSKKIQSTEYRIQNTELCPECGAELQMSEGCCLCLSCGYSKCSL